MTNKYKLRAKQSSNDVKKLCNNIYNVNTYQSSTIHQNVIENLRNTHLEKFTNDIKNLAFHNLCKNKQKISSLTKRVLGLGHKFCIKEKLLTNHLCKTFQRFDKSF